MSVPLLWKVCCVQELCSNYVVEAGDTVKALKNKIQEVEGISPDYIQLQQKGLALGDEVSLEHLQEGSIDMTMTLRGRLRPTVDI